MNAGELLGLARDALGAAGEPEAELALRVAERGCARFAAGALGQHMELVEPQAVARVARGSRVAEAITTRIDRDALVEAIHGAARAAALVPEVDGFPGFGDGSDEGALPAGAYAAATADATPASRVARVRPALAAIAAAGLVGAGMLETRTTHAAIATTRGLARRHASTRASFKVWALETPGAGGAAGSGSDLRVDVGALGVEAATEAAVRACVDGRSPAALAPGVYDVVLEPEAIAELLEWLAAIAFGAPEVAQGTSPVSGDPGARLTGGAIDLSEDPSGGDGGEAFGAPFDREGSWRRRVPLVARGVAGGVLTDRTWAARGGTTSTGSALWPAPGAEGGVGAAALSLAGGEEPDVGALLAGLDRGLYVRRLHYVNGLIDPRRAVMTGLTRDGCFLVERGRVTRAVHNLRFTERFLEALGRADGMTRARQAVATAWSDDGVVVAPAVRLRAFRFEPDM